MRGVATIVGALSTLAGCALLLTPLSAPLEPPVVPTVGLVALLALVAGALGTVDRSRTAPETATLPDPSGRADGEAPGDAFDRALADVSGRPGSDDRAAVRERLDAVAVARLRATDDCTAAEARRRLASGDWTRDEAAAAFFADGARSQPLRERVRHLLTGEPRFSRRARRAIDALYDREPERDGPSIRRDGGATIPSDHATDENGPQPARAGRRPER